MTRLSPGCTGMACNPPRPRVIASSWKRASAGGGTAIANFKTPAGMGTSPMRRAQTQASQQQQERGPGLSLCAKTRPCVDEALYLWVGCSSQKQLVGGLHTTRLPQSLVSPAPHLTPSNPPTHPTTAPTHSSRPPSFTMSNGNAPKTAEAEYTPKNILITGGAGFM